MKQNYIAENIRRYRERLNLTQQGLADRVGVTWEMISRYERNTSSPMNKIEIIAKALGVSKSQLFEEHVPEKINNISFKVPLYISIPKKSVFDLSQVHYFYACPEWIATYKYETVAIDNKIIRTELDQIDLAYDGVCYFANFEDYKTGDLVLFRKEDRFEIREFIKSKKEIPLGRLIGTERRYI